MLQSDTRRRQSELPGCSRSVVLVLAGAILGAVLAVGTLIGAVYLHWRLVGESRAAGRENEDGFPPWVLWFYPTLLFGGIVGGWVGSRLARRGRRSSA